MSLYTQSPQHPFVHVTPAYFGRALVILGCAVLAFTVSAVGQVATPISKVPFTITKPGNYVVKRDISFAPATGNAITIGTDNVTLDLGGHTLTNTAGTATSASGIYSEGRSGITIRNGTVRGFRCGINLSFKNDAETRRNVVNSINADRCTGLGIFLAGDLCTVRDCTVTETGGSTLQTEVHAYGIVVEGDEATIQNCDVLNTGTPAQYAHGIQVDSGNGSLIENNRVRNKIATPYSTGVGCYSFGQNFVTNNRVASFLSGIELSGSTGKYRDNIVLGCTTPYSGGSNAGNNQ